MFEKDGVTPSRLNDAVIFFLVPQADSQLTNSTQFEEIKNRTEAAGKVFIEIERGLTQSIDAQIEAAIKQAYNTV